MRIWKELGQAKFNDEYLCLLISHKRTLIKWYNVTILIFSGSGILGWTFLKIPTTWACIIVAVISLLKLLEVEIIPSEKTIDKINKGIRFYTQHYLNMERVWYGYETEKVSESDSLDKLQELCISEIEMNDTINEFHSKPIKRLKRKAIILCDNYFKTTF